MNSKKITAIALGLALATVCAVGAVASFAADTNKATTTTQKTQTKDKSAKTDKKDVSTKTAKSGKGSITFVGIDAVAAEVLGVSAESLADLNHADQLYAVLAEAGKVDAFKAALIAAKQAQYDAKADYGKFSAEKLAEKLAAYTQVINDWDGSTELIVSTAKTKVK